jgi:predicted RNA-binding protein with PIN domain
MTLTIVDAMNVIGSRPQTRWWRERDQAMRNFIEDLTEWGTAQLEAGDDVLVVFDGDPVSGLDAAPLPLIFAERPGPDGADDLIVEIVEDDEDPETIVVITSDARLRGRLATLGVHVDGVSTLLRHIPR